MTMVTLKKDVETVMVTLQIKLEIIMVTLNADVYFTVVNTKNT